MNAPRYFASQEAAEQIADAIGYRPHAEAVDANWPLLLVSRGDRELAGAALDNAAREGQDCLQGMRAREDR